MKKNLVYVLVLIGVIVVLVAVLFMTHVICIHEWNEATCDTPKTCVVCGDTEGEALGHKWADATCDKPKTCSICGATEGEALGCDIFNWTVDSKPSCSKEGEQHGTCVRCGKVYYEHISKLNHTDGEWQITKEYVINGDGTVTPGTNSLMCAVCGEEIRNEPYTIELTLGQINALKSARDHIESIHCSYSFVMYMLTTYDGFSSEDAEFAANYCGADWNEQASLKCEELINEGYSERGIKEELRFYRFTDAQIDYAMDGIEF